MKKTKKAEEEKKKGAKKNGGLVRDVIKIAKVYKSLTPLSLWRLLRNCNH